MSRLSEKYIAGFFDADGSVGFAFRNYCTKPQIVVSFSQKTSQDRVLHLIQGVIGGNLGHMTIKGNSYSKLTVNGKKAVIALNRIRKHLVLKRHYVNVCLDMIGKRVNDVNATKVYLKEQRKIKSLPVPSFPSRKWLAGYFDGDGCLSVHCISQNGYALPVVHIVCSSFDSEGIETIHKNFGGHINGMKGHDVKQWSMTMVPSNAERFLGYFSKHLITKREQAEFILGCAAMGHFRDGKNIKAALKNLKAHDHRLNEPTVPAVVYIDSVRDLEKVKRSHESYLPKHKRTEAIVGTQGIA